MDKRGVIALFAVLLVFSGCILGGDDASPENRLRAEEDEFIKENPKNERAKGEIEKPTTTTASTTSTTTTSTTTTLGSCPYDCCDGKKHAKKTCSEWFRCVNNTCVEKPCPYDCCVLGMYETKDCRPPLECVGAALGTGRCSCPAARRADAVGRGSGGPPWTFDRTGPLPRRPL